jgi:hypothetical protein
LEFPGYAIVTGFQREFGILFVNFDVILVASIILVEIFPEPLNIVRRKLQETIVENQGQDQGRLKPKFYCVHFPFTAFSYYVWRPIYCGGAFGACVFGTR